MAKNILAFFGLVFLTLVIVAGVYLVGYFYDSVGLINLPDEVTGQLDRFVSTPEVTIRASDSGSPQWVNPLEDPMRASPTPWPTFTVPFESAVTTTPLPTPTTAPTATPVPPLDPRVYQTDTIIGVKRFASALEAWLDVNEKLADNRELLNDAQWRGEIAASLAEVSAAGQSLAAIGPPPEEYRGLDTLFDRLAEESYTLEANYHRALETADPDDFATVGETFYAIREYLTQAVNEMITMGWSLE
ncbi:MAG: hypothetical protein GX491_05735 [Chloroflexi bacterium]|nr:hypothetical protein [Chloroflexota bacterium]